MNYSELFAAVQSYTENQFPDTGLADGSVVTTKTQIDTFIQQAEQRIYNTVQFPSLRKNATLSLSVGNQYLPAPNDFLAVYYMAVIAQNGEYEFLIPKDVSYIRQAYPSPTATGRPKHYALFGPTTINVIPPVVTPELSFILGPTPNTAYAVDLQYFHYPESIVTAGTTWLGDNFDSVLLYGALSEAATFMKAEQDTIAEYNAKYKEALAMAKRLGDDMERTDANRSGQYRRSAA